MKVVFGIDVSKTTSTICVLIDGNQANEFVIDNNAISFKTLLKNLHAFTQKPQIIFEATGVYSRRLAAFLDGYDYSYVIMNPLKAKKEMSLGLRHNKTDKNDAYHLALIQSIYKHPVNVVQAEVYQQMQAISHFYDQLTKDTVSAKNRLHQALQSTFPEIEFLLHAASGNNYWHIVRHYPHCELVRESDSKQIAYNLMHLKA